MSIYSLHVSNVSRASGSSSLASLSYNTSRRMHDDRTGETYYGYGRRERVVMTATVLPDGAPREFEDMERLFNAVEAADKAANARPAKKVMVALPRELTEEQRLEALERFVREQFTADGYAAVYAVHTDKDGSNPHAHILVANRQIDPETGRWTAKRRMAYKLDEHGRRIPRIDPETGMQKTDKRGRKQWVRVSEYVNPLDTADKLNAMRKGWADACNALLPEEAHIDHRSLEERGIDRLPTVHEGYAAREIEKRGGVSPLCEANRETRRLNRVIERIREQIGMIAYRLTTLLRQGLSHGTEPAVAKAMGPREPVERKTAAALSVELRDARGAEGRAYNDLVDAKDEPASTGHLNPLRRRLELAEAMENRHDDANAAASREPRRPRKPVRDATAPEYSCGLASETAEARETSHRREEARRAEREREWDPSDPSDPMNLAMGGDTGLGYGL